MALTKVTGGVVSTTTNLNVGVVTATKFVGGVEITSGNIVATAATFSGNVSVAGTLTYQDVTNVDSIGVGTFQSNVQVGAGISVVGVSTFSGDIDANADIELAGNLAVTGVSTFTGNIDANGALDVDGQTDLDVLNVSDTATFSGDLQIDSDSAQIKLGDDQDLLLYHNGSNGFLKNSTGQQLYRSDTHTFENAAGSTEYFRIAADGKVGINTTTLTEQLEVDGDIRVRNAVKYRDPNGDETGNISMGDDDNLTIQSFGTSGHITFDTGSSADERVRIAADGKFGIGVTPISIFHVRPLDETNFLVRNEGSTVVLASETNSGRDNNRAMALEASHFEFIEGGSEKIRIDSSGAVGINSASPTANYKLDVNGDLTLGEIAGTDNTFIDQKQDGDLHLINSGRTANGASNTPGAGGVGINRYNNIAGGTSLFRDFTVYNGKGSKILSVDGSAAAVGIGTDTPSRDLHVKSAVPYIRVESISANEPGTLELYHTRGNGSDKWPSSVSTVDGGLTLNVAEGTNGAPKEKVRINNAGKVGVNTTTSLNAGAMTLYSANEGEGTATGQLELKDNAAFGSTPTGGIIFSGHHTTGSTAIFAGIRGFKANTGDGDLDGCLAFDVRKHGAVAYEAMRINEDGHMGLGVTPSAWSTSGDFRGLQVGTGAALFGRGSGDEDRGGISVNYYHTGSAEKYIGNGHAARIYLADGNIHFSNAAANSSGADAAMTLNERLRIDNNGKLLAYGGLTASNLPTTGNAADAAIHVRGSNKFQGIAFGASAVSATVGVDGQNGAIVYTGNAAPANLGGGEKVTHEWWTGSAGGGGPSHVMSLTTSGNLGIGTSAPGALLHTWHATSNTAATFESGDAGAGINLRDPSQRSSIEQNGTDFIFDADPDGSFANSQFRFKVDNSTKLEIGTDGHLYNTCASSSLASLTLRKTSNSDSIDFMQCRSNSNALRMVIHADGDVNNQDNSYGQTSDVKLKENIVDANSQWADIKAIKVRNFNFKASTGMRTHKQIGVVAQEIETVSAGLVSEFIDRNPDTGEDLGTTTKSVKYSVLYMKAIKALQESMSRIETLEAKVASLESS